MSKLQKTWENAQIKAFTKWVQGHLKSKGVEVEDIFMDFRTGEKLILLLEGLSNESLGKYRKNPKMRIQQIENVNKALKFISDRGVKLASIGGEDIIDGHRKLTLGLVWTLILRFDIAEISMEELTAKEALLLWCQRKTQGYEGVNVKDFHFSFQNGLAFNALIHKHKPGLLDYSALSPANKRENLVQAFEIAEHKLGIAQFLDAEDMCDVKPDERSVMAYVAQYFHAFADSGKTEVAGRRVSKLVAVTQGNEELKKKYNEDARALLEWIDGKVPVLEDLTFDNTLDGVKSLIEEHKNFRATEKVEKSQAKIELENLFNTIQVKLRNMNRSAFVPEEDISPEAIGRKWDGVLGADGKREEALRVELARQEKLSSLVRRFKIKAEKLEQLATEKETYLDKREPIDTISAAQSALKFLDGHDAQFEQSKERVGQLRELANEIIELDFIEKDWVSEKMGSIESWWERLENKSGEKRTYLNEELEKQELMDKKRIEFAEMINNANGWFVNEIDLLGAGESFGESLPEVEAYQEKLDARKEELQTASDQKVAELQAKFDELVELGVKENKFTMLSLDDMASQEEARKTAFEKLEQDYAAELERQRSMDAKRKEFADLAAAIVAFCAERTQAIDALEGEPEDLSAAISALYADGTPEAEKIAEIRKVETEAIAMQIAENQYTEHTIASLEAITADVGLHVRAYLASLAEEKKMKEEYAAVADKFMSWVAETTDAMKADPVFDNTLTGANAAMAEFSVHMTKTRPPKAADKASIVSRHELIVKRLDADAHPRPAFAPGVSLDDVAAAWNALGEAENGRKELLVQELKRQEKLDAQQKQFLADAARLTDWCNKKKSDLEVEEVVNALTQAQIHLSLLGVFDEEYASTVPEMDALKALGGEIIDADFVDKSVTESTLADVDGLFSSLKELEAAKKGRLEEKLASEQEKEVLRLKFADSARQFSEWARTTTERLGKYVFGDSLEGVQAYRATMEEENGSLRRAGGDLQSAALALWTEMQEKEITENVHSSVTEDDIAYLMGAFEEAVEARTTAYEAELGRFDQMEEMKKKFAGVAEEMVQALSENRNALDAAAKEGEPEEKVGAINATYAEGTELDAKLQECVDVDAQCKELHVVENKYTPLTIQSLTQKRTAHSKFYQNLLAVVEQERVMQERRLEREAEWAEQTKLEEQRNLFNTTASLVSAWLDNTDEVVSDVIAVSTVPEVETLQGHIAEIDGQMNEQKASYDVLADPVGVLAEDGEIQAAYASLQEKWTQTLDKVEERRGALQAELEAQQANEDLRIKFAEKANALHDWIVGEREKKPAIGELEAQLEANREHLKAVEANSGAVNELNELDEEVAVAEIKENPHTTHTMAELNVAFEELKKMVEERANVVEKEILSKKLSGVSAEELEEFRETFQAFDKDHSGALQWFEFKAVLASLGEDLDDDTVRGVVKEYDQDGSETIDFDEFTQFMLKRRTDQDSLEQISAAFKDIAAGKAYVTVDDMAPVMSQEEIEYLTANMPPSSEAEGGYDYNAWATTAFE